MELQGGLLAWGELSVIVNGGGEEWRSGEESWDRQDSLLYRRVHLNCRLKSRHPSRKKSNFSQP